MKKIVLIAIIITTSFKLFSQAEKIEQKFGVIFSGYIKNDFFYDTRQTVSAREGHILLWPAPQLPDINGADVNAKANFNFLAIQSRLSVDITGLDAFGAKTSGRIEGDFFGQSNTDFNVFSLRHALIKLKWTSTELLTGQSWNPLLVLGCYPGTVSFNTGIPFQSFSRNPQVRITQSFGKIKIIAAALSQRDHSSIGEAGATSSYLRNSATPDFHFQIHYIVKNEEEETEIFSGLGIEYKTIVPRLYSTITTAGIDTIYKVTESVSGLTAIAFSKIKIKPLTFKIQGRYGENIPDIFSASGFAVKNVLDAQTGELDYSPLTNMTVWADLQSNGKNVQFGLFGGFCKSLGSKKTLTYTDVNGEFVTYGLGQNIESIFRFSPRVIFYSGKYQFATEIEYTSATFGTGFDSSYLPLSTSTVANTRYYYQQYTRFN